MQCKFYKLNKPLTGMLLLIALFISHSSFALDDRTKNELFLDGKPINHYEVLQVPSSANEEEIKKAYRKRAMATHPDRNPGKSDLAFQQVGRAYKVLTNPAQRKVFDQILVQAKNQAPKMKANQTRAPTPPSPPPPQTASQKAADAYVKTQKSIDPLDKIPSVLKTSDGSFRNYFAVAGVKASTGPVETKAAIEKKFTELESELHRFTPAEYANRKEALLKAEEILLDPNLKQLYLEKAKTIFVKDFVSGQRMRYDEVLRSYTPRNRSPIAPQPSHKKCEKLFAKIFDIFK